MAFAETFDRSARPLLRAVHDGDKVCQDCFGSMVVEDDGSISGTVGGLVDCICVELAVPPGFVECRACAALVRVTGLAARHDELVAEYLAVCAASGLEPAWCLHCGEYLPLGNGARPPCGCGQTGAAGGRHLGAFMVAGPWGVER
jgi:hypothetical protein